MNGYPSSPGIATSHTTDLRSERIDGGHCISRGSRQGHARTRQHQHLAYGFAGPVIIVHYQDAQAGQSAIPVGGTWSAKRCLELFIHTRQPLCAKIRFYLVEVCA
jgi:hypothetical protein